MDFYLPSYLESDFDDVLATLGESCVLNYNAITPTSFDGLITTLDFKSNMRGLSDTTKSLQCSKSLSIKKGDYVTDSDDNIYLVNWNPQKELNCKNCQIQICNKVFDFVRWQDSIIDSDGNSLLTTTPTGYISIADDCYGYITRTGFSQYDSAPGDAGIFQTQRIEVGVQYNTETALIEISHQFEMDNIWYIITDISTSQLNSSGTDGLLIINAQVIEGGTRAAI